MITLRYGLAAASLVMSSAIADVSSVLVKEGDFVPRTIETIDVLNDPTIDGKGRVGFTGSVTSGDRFVWWNDGAIWYNSAALPVILTGAESTCGVSDDGGWIYSPAEGGLDAVWSNGVSLQKDTDPAVDFRGQFITFCSRPQMSANGVRTWIAGVGPTQGGGTNFRALMVEGSSILTAGDVFDGLAIASGSGLGFAYDFSPNGANFIIKAVVNAAATENDVMIVGDSLVAREGQPTGFGDNWALFDDVGINDSGQYAFSGDTNGPVATDGFIVRNNAVVAREGTAIAGLTPTGNPRAVSIANNGRIGAIWATNAGEALFLFTQNGTDGYDAEVLLKVGDLVDTDNDGIGDAAVLDFNAATVVGPGLRLAERCASFVNVDLALPTAEREAIVRVPMPEFGLLADLTGDGIVDGADLGELLAGWGEAGPSDLNCDGTTDGADLGVLLANWSR